MDENDDEINGAISPIQIAVMWAKSKGISYPKDREPEYIDLAFESQGFCYSATLSETGENTLTIAIAYELSDRGKELELRRHIDKVNLAKRFGALIFDHERQMVVWRESITGYVELQLVPEDITELITLGVEIFDALRAELSGFMGLSPSDALLANAQTLGRA